MYELVQLYDEPMEYFSDFWNYLEIGGIILFVYASILDILNDKCTDNMRILFSFSMIFCLIKVVYLVRVFR